jgi:outer membrane protein OmpA-like peptidoglycan-associated protein
LIEAYTDNKGDEVSPQQLTQERARVLSDHFQTAGVDPTKIQANGMGASNPVVPNTTLANRAKNRRVEITFTSPLPRTSAAN